MTDPLAEAPTAAQAAPAPAAPAAPPGEAPPAPQPARRAIPRSKPFPWLYFVAVAVVAGGGWFIVSKMSDVSNMQDCVMSGRRNCAPIDMPRK